MKIAIIGLGYVGLPLAVAFARQHEVVGFDIDRERVRELESGSDRTGEVPAEELKACGISFTTDSADMRGCEVFIVTVPTPIDDSRRPDLTAVLQACDVVGKAISPGAIVVFESTVYPGVTEEICGPALASASGLEAGQEFKLGYSPERINPGDKERPITKIVKIVAGQDAETLDRLANLYGGIIAAGVYRAPTIKVAEAAKVIENTQRDLNIALMNELSKICDLLDINTREVLAAAGTKWNFLNFYPGLVGGHCIGVDPYYLTAKAEQIGYHPEVILAGRKLNDGMGAYVAQRVVKLLAQRGHPVSGARVGILGLTFKQNVPDTRNSKVADVIEELRAFGIQPIIHDPLVPAKLIERTFGAEPSDLSEFADLHALVFAVSHDEYQPLTDKISDKITANGVLIDVPASLNARRQRQDISYWSL